MPFTIVRDDLKNYETDAVAVSANANLIIDGGGGLAVASKIGLEKIQHLCDLTGGCTPGNAVTVETGDARNPLIIFAVGPVWKDGNHDEPAILRDTVASVLREATSHGAKHLALPLISTGAFGFPPKLAFEVTTQTIKAYLQSHEMDVTLVLYDRDAVRAAVDYGDIRRFIDDNYVDVHDAHQMRRRKYSHHPRFDPMPGEPLSDFPLQAPCTHAASAQQSSFPHQAAQAKLSEKKDLFKRRKKKKKKSAAEPTLDYGEILADVPDGCVIEAPAPIPGSSISEMPESSPVTWDEHHLEDEELDSWLKRKHDSFTVTLFKMIDTRGMADVDVYKRANMSRQLFSKIRSDVNYHPKKKTVLALAVALELSLPETRELLDCAGFSLSRSSQFDLIIEYFIRKNVYDCFAINEALFAFGEELLS